MKKIFLSGGVIALFIIYSIYAHVTGYGQIVPIIKRTSSSTPSPSTSQAASPAQPDGQTQTPSAVPSKSQSKYKDGTYIGDPEDAFYGTIQVQTTIHNGKITNVTFLQAPNDRSTSVFINSQADPILAQEAVQAQSANVDIVSGATDSSQAFIQSLQTALNQAQN